jgi:Tfp pilus assembly protein PilV
MTGRWRNATGLTLVEAMLSVVLAATLVVMALGTFGSVARGRRVAYYRYTASMLASQLMTEVLANLYQDAAPTRVFGPETGEVTGTRSAFEDVDDYNSWTESPPQLKDGTVMPNLTGWRRTVVVDYVYPDTLAPTGGTDLGLKRVTVTVYDPRGVQTILVGLRSSIGTYDQKPDVQTSAVRWVGVDLQVGSDPAGKVSAGTGVPNIIPSGGS